MHDEELEKLAAVLHQANHVAKRRLPKKYPNWKPQKWQDLDDEERQVWVDTARSCGHEGLMNCPRCSHAGHHPIFAAKP